MATYYRWRRSTITYKITQIGSTTYDGPGPIYSYKETPPITSDGQFDFSGAMQLEIYSGQYYPNVCIYGYLSTVEGVTPTAYKGVTEPTELRNNFDVLTFSPAVAILEPTPAAGTFVDYVYSTSYSTYPNGGVSGSYYYDQRTTITSPTTPTGLTYPATITTPSVSISWAAATSSIPNCTVSQYEVSYSVNGGSSWTVAGTTASTSYSFSIPAGTTSITFRVRARDSNDQWGNYVTGTASQVFLAPTLTVPQIVMQGQQATISWSAIEGADSYTLQRKANTDADWTQVYSGAVLTFAETVGTWTSVQYRVQAVFDGTPGGWAESAAIPVVSASALVISGTDGDLGTLVNDVPYSISTDTGNQITAKITVNSAVIFSGNVGNSTAGTIPVLDLVNGTGTIVIEASVTSGSSPVSAVRTWTYTKAAITFPDAGSVALLTQEGKNIFPKTLAECVRLPSGKTLDEVTAFPCQIYVGSYTGTGTYGASNPNELTCPFPPKVWGILAFPSAGDPQAPTTNLVPWGLTPAILHSTASVCSYDGNTVDFYNVTSAANQCNTSGATYYYIFLG